MIRFDALASSSDGCCYVLRSGTRPPLLIDAGIKYSDIQRGMRFKASSLAGALISHGHGDHCKAVQNLMEAGIDCYASRETWGEIKLGLHHRAHKLTAESQVQIGPWGVRPFSAVHDSPGTLGFYIASPCGAKGLYLTDSAYSPYTFEGLTHLFVECNYSREILRRNTLYGSLDAERFKRTTQNHMSLDRLLGFLAANDLSKVQEIHLLHLSDANSDEVAFKEAVQRATGKPVYVAAKRQA